MTGTGWPALKYETLPWDRQYPPGAFSRTQLQRHRGAYQAAIAPEIGKAEPRLPGDVLAIADDAANELARFDAEMGGEIAPFGSILLRSESAASSQIENKGLTRQVTIPISAGLLTDTQS
ncbi:hypothetical protein RB614_30965 [Phytohabitans sp. ZYX-F-186]|uniref:Uncharacterized protein n=1 Tax=Phytohabitans maris TaxID=3071409 RepID=A0ABU0ZPI7_9ACTN|nr:hypothetical protein [Phytohabitans sp. ZYX-F-186]MDQ7908954.1 hypothetical protein [Phytohabitans sp. ZYX-F-186]